MWLDNLKLLLRLFVRPRSTMSVILDEGSFLFGVVAVMALTLVITSSGSIVGAMPEYVPDEAVAADLESESEMVALLALGGVWSKVGTFSVVAGLVLLYVPVLIFIMTLADARTGSFGVALTRDYGSIGPCILISFAAAELLCGGLWLVASFLLPAGGPERWVPALAVAAVLVLVGTLYFVSLAWIAVRTVYGTSAGAAVLATVLPIFAMPAVGMLGMLASPFILYWLYLYTRNDISSIQWSMGARRAFKRHMEACTLNPRDADAHLQLGLIHQHRRQYPEAIARFQKAIEIDPQEIDAHFQLGRIEREQGRHAEAIRHFEVVVARDAKYKRYEIWREVGGTYFDAGDLSNAKAMLERYVEQRPYDPEGLCLLGQTLKKLGEKDKAREVLTQCVDAAKTAPVYRRGELRQWRKRAEAEL